jgi:uncharacterized membrane protein YphA (DoxX/SURF4 family)
MLKKIVLASLCILLGGVFILSGISKLYPIEPFEFSFVETELFNWQAAPFVARLFIALELLLGFLLLVQLNLKKYVYKLSIALLAFFCIYLAIQLISGGNEGNCGCFGSWIEMTPLQAMLKNGVMLGVLALLYKKHDGWQFKTKYAGLILFPVLIAIATPFILNPIALDYSEAYLNRPENNFHIELDSLYVNAKADFPVPPKTLSEGKHIIAFLSLTCGHCKIAARKMALINKLNPRMPFYFVFNGSKENLKAFYAETHAEAIPYSFLGGRAFVYLAGTSFPTIYLVNTETVEGDLNYLNLSQEEIEKWLIK